MRRLADIAVACVALVVVSCGGGASSPAAPQVVLRTKSLVNATPLDVPANSFGRSQIFVDLPGAVTAVKVSVRAVTARDAGGACDLFFVLRHPDGTPVRLNQNDTSGPLCGTNLFTAIFPDPTPTVEPLSRLFGKPGQGSWLLEVDNESHFGGPARLESWTLEVTTQG